MENVRFNKLWGNIFKKSFLPLLFVILVAIFYNGTYQFYLKEILSDEHEKFIEGGIFIITALLVTYWAQRIAGLTLTWYRDMVAGKTRTPLDDEFIPLFNQAGRAVIWIIGGIIILSHFNVDTKAILASLGVGSLAIALAAQDTIANIISGFMIMVDRPFRVGDEIRLPSGEKVKVIDIGVRRSKFLSEEKAIVIVPNLELSKSKIINYTYGKE